jgi:hypothetical protein
MFVCATFVETDSELILSISLYGKIVHNYNSDYYIVECASVDELKSSGSPDRLQILH